MPSLGADMESGRLMEWLVKPGDTVHRGDLVAVVDTDKAEIEVESFHDGVVGALLVEPGTRVAVGTPMARIGGGAAVAPKATPRATPRTTPRATPPVRHHAAELGVDLDRVVGTGPDARIRREDVDAAVRATAPSPPVRRAARPVPARGTSTAVPPTGERRPRVSPYARRLAAEMGIDTATLEIDGPVTAARVLAAAAAEKEAVAAPAAEPTREATTPQPHQTGHTGRGAIGALMSRSKREVPHYYVATTVDLGATTAWLRRTNKERPVSGRIVPAAALLKATALALKEQPALNGFWVDDEFRPADDVHLGVAVSVRGGGLVAPAIHRTAARSLPEVMSALRDLVGRVRHGRLTRAEMADPTFTVTDLGDQGVEEVVGVIYPPQVALLGIGRVVERPWAVDGMLAVRPVVRLTLSGDHRVTDGATAARFLNRVDALLQEPEEL